MKLHNPFKWHVAKIAPDTYVVRKRSILLFWWVYADIDDTKYTWGFDRIKYCLTPSLDQAISVAKIRRAGGEVVWS